MRRDILTKNERIAELEASMTDQKNSYETKLQNLTHKLETSVTQKTIQLQDSEAAYQEQVEALKKELKVWTHCLNSGAHCLRIITGL